MNRPPRPKHETKYRYAAIPTIYKGILFRSRLEARYATFFDLLGWHWEYEPFDIEDWIPDFLLHIPCRHSECSGHHRLLCEVKPYQTLDEFDGHPCLDYPYGGYSEKNGGIGYIPADASAAFGYHPKVSHWEMVHGAGGGEECLQRWVEAHHSKNMEDLWKRAGEQVMYKRPRRPS